MKENIVMISHSFHSFLINEIEYVANNFKNVFVICPYNKQIQKKFDSKQNVKLNFFKKRNIYINAIFNIKRFFEKDVIDEIKEAKSKKKLDILYLKKICTYFGIEKILEKNLNKYNIKEDTGKWALLSMWYDATAYAIARQKDKYPKIATISLAHSYEIDKKKNDYVDVLFRKKYHNKLDLLSFISKKVYLEFRRDLAKSLNLDCKNTEFYYLGTKRILDKKAKLNDDIATIKVLSCSNINRIKRVDLINDALEKIKDYKIEWYHIGTCPKFKKTTSKMINKNHNANCKINFLGYKENYSVHKFMTEKKWDVFINLSSSEGIPVSIMEAIAYGIPVIATNVGGNSEIVENNFGKLLSENPDIEEIDRAILEIKKLSNNTKEEYSRNAIKKFDDNFNADVIREEFYKRIIRM